MIPSHIKRDLTILAYERTLEVLKRTAFTFGRDPQLCTIAGSAGLRAAFAFLFIGLKKEGTADSLSAAEILEIWVQESKDEIAKLDKFYQEEANG